MQNWLALYIIQPSYGTLDPSIPNVTVSDATDPNYLSDFYTS